MTLQIQILPVTPFRQNCTLIWDDETKDAVLTDVGGDIDYIMPEIEKRSLKLNAVWLTHGHLDHASGVPMLLERVNVPVIGPHQDDLFLLESLPETTAAYKFPVCPAFVPTRWLNEGEQLTVGNYTFDVLHIPGHTPGQVVFYCAAAELLIAGDVLFYESIGRTDFPRGNHQDLLENIAKKLYTLPENTLVVPGHGRTTTIGHEKQYNPYVRA
ncbi:MBL fold metallo-hydrolase [Kingella negevensis]|uniref:MBL fold metallo-hydrolase n=1 Tax=Kingella negevensis TaxID=1522312 RepID=UPI00254A7085|nr:MBL fold metallo-hydrolase [Kingella negevensis]MDK4683749.1 MBL fold metallo-hydrolase [Kingella negevensis]MDK4708249.1 MBL fold metallo-hydrolase [Kingella negevensis]MDK4709085.1 MBL fold metallo-hydrolase [Kingella negevensis]